MSILDKVSKETLQNIKMVFPRKKTGDISGVVKSGLYPLFLQLFGLIGFLACQVTKIYEIF